MKLNDQGDEVRALQLALAHARQAPPADELADGWFGDGTAASVRAVQAAAGLPATGEVDAATSAALGKLVDTAAYAVSGMVSVAAGSASTAGLRVEIVDKNVGGDAVMAAATTDAAGRFAATIKASAVIARGKAAPDLQARAIAGKATLGASAVRYNAVSPVRLDIALPASAASGLRSEHESLLAAIGAQYRGALAQLQESAARQDITYLGNKIGWDARAVALATLADRLAQTSKLPAALHYALLRAGLPADEGAHYGSSSSAVTAIWTGAIAQGVIPAALRAQLPAAAQTYQQLAASHSLDAAVAGLSTLRSIVTVSLGDDKQKALQFATLQAQYASDPARLWQAVTEQLGATAAARLQLDGKLAYLTLDNAPLLTRLHQKAQLAAPQDLVAAGFYNPAAWAPLIGTDVPATIPGDTAAAKAAAYAKLLAAQVRISFPTAVVADLVKTKALALPAPPATIDAVHAFLAAQSATFAIGAQSIDQYLVRQKLQLAPVAVAEIKRIQRVYQLTPDDAAMNALIDAKLDAAYHIVQYSEDEFARSYSKSLGGDDTARAVHAKARQVHATALSVAFGYVQQRNFPQIGSTGAQMLPGPTFSAPPADATAFPTLDNLFGQMDYCACDDCKSILSPAAYLVDLLQFCNPPVNKLSSPQSVLFARRPDLPYLPLTCENTNTALPYIDVVNETLEYYVVHSESLAGYQGHDTDGTIDSASLLANPQFVDAAAYDILVGEKFPAPLPFHRRLELLRRTQATFGAPLASVMTTLRPSDNVERGAQPYGWRDIAIESAGVSRQEYALVTDSTIALADLYGYPAGTTEAQVRAALSPLRAFARRVGIEIADVVAILQTRFINPAVALIPKLARLHLSFQWLADYRSGVHSDADLAAALASLAPALDLTQYGGNVGAWLKDDANWRRIAGLIVLANPAEPNQLCKIDELALRYADPAQLGQPLRAIDLVKLARFVRLWRKLGWSIAQTDDAISALYPAADAPTGTSDAADLVRLDQGFTVLVPRLGALIAAMPALGVTPQSGLAQLLALWGDLPADLYAQMFQSPTLLAPDAAFATSAYGQILDGSALIVDHLDTLRGAFNLTGAELALILADLGVDATTRLLLPIVSAIFRRGWLARAMRLSVRELLLLASSSGIDPFAPPDPPSSPLAAFLALRDALAAAPLQPVQVLYQIWNQDLIGTSAPADQVVHALASSLRAAFADIAAQFAVVDDADGSIARARVALVYGQDATDFLFGLVDQTYVVSVPFSADQPTLDPAVVTASAGRLAYDDFAKRLSYAGILSPVMRTAIATAAPAFAPALAAIDAAGAAAVTAFFAQYPALAAVQAIALSDAPPATKRPQILPLVTAALVAARTQQQALTEIASAARVDAAFAQALLADPAILTSAAGAGHPALDDLVALATADPVLAAAWTGYVLAPATGFTNFSITTDATAVALTIDGAAVTLSRTGTVWTSASPLSLTAGALTGFALSLTGATGAPELRWETASTGWAPVPSAALYRGALIDNLRAIYVRFLKATALATALRLTADELAFATRSGWLNQLGVTAPTTGAAAAALLDPLRRTLALARLKAALSADDDRLLAVLEAPGATLPNAAGALVSLTGWDTASLTALLGQFQIAIAALADPLVLARVFDAFALLSTMGVGAAALIAATTNDPTDAQVASLQAALRARYDAPGWLAAVKPINDAVRKLSRDALVAHVLRRMSESSDPAIAAIDSADKLFEYFLVDVEMDCCMETSRIRLALSSVQLFIERCLMNLEPAVSPDSIDAIAWQWMKRYRVWQANREVFLWPENWLDPELRDDASPIFKETINALLQSDITDDAAASALLAYLGKLEEVAKLEVCGMYYEEPSEGRANDVLHVVARTAGAHRKYFYRRRAASAWTAWEQIKLDIEDNPITPVVWNGRLFVVWLKILKQSPVDASTMATASGVNNVGSASLGAIKSDAQTDARGSMASTMVAILNLSERVNGIWGPTKTSDPNLPTRLGGGFDRSSLGFAFQQTSDGLSVSVTGSSEGGGFLIYNTHSAPVRFEDLPPVLLFNFSFHWRALYYAGTNDLSLEYRASIFGPDETKKPLSTSIADTALQQGGPLGNIYTDPFFYQDARYGFCVETTLSTVTLPNAPYGFGLAPSQAIPDIPRLIVSLPPGILHPGDPVEGLQPGSAVDPVAITRLVAQDANIRIGLAGGSAVKVGDVTIGALGAIQEERS